MPYIAAVVDEAGKVATLGSVYDGVVVNAEHVAATDALLLVALLPHVRNHLKEEDDPLLEVWQIKEHSMLFLWLQVTTVVLMVKQPPIQMNEWDVDGQGNV